MNKPIVNFTVLDGREKAVSQKPLSSGFILHSPKSFNIAPGQYSDVDFDIAVDIPEGYVGLMHTVGQLSRFKAVNANDSVIHPYYRKTLHLSVVNNGHDVVEIRKGDPVCVLIVMAALLDYEIS